MIEIFGARRLEGSHLAALRIYSRHDVLDGAILAGRIHGLEDQQQRPAVLRIEHILQIGQGLNSGLQGFLRARLVSGRQLAGVFRIHIFQPELFPLGNSKASRIACRFRSLHWFSCFSVQR